MDAVKFLKERKRMCRVIGTCQICPIGSDDSCAFVDYADGEQCDIEWMVNNVEKWSKEHPQKTYKDDFLEKFTNAQIDEFKVPRVHWCEVYNDGVCRYKSTGGMHLCCDCWNEPMED